MRKKLVWRFYCDHCRKSGCSGGHMAKHEKHCCGNPDRVCRMCERGQTVQPPIDDLIAALERGVRFVPSSDPAFDGWFEADLTALRAVAESCPACMLAAIIQLKKRNPGESYNIEFDFKAEAKEFWSNVRDAEGAFA